MVAETPDGRGGRFLNPCVLHLQKMELELKCPACLKLLNQPILLPCNHIFCSLCLPNTMVYGLDCPACSQPFLRQDMRAAPHMETMVAVYKSMNTAFGANLLQPMSRIDAKESLNEHQKSCKTPNLCNTSVEDKPQEQPAQSLSRAKPFSNTEDTFINHGEPYSPPSFGGAKDSDDDSNGPGSVNRSPKKGSCKRELGPEVTRSAGAAFNSLRDGPIIGQSNYCKSDAAANQRLISGTDETPDRERKRQKLDSELADKAGTNDDPQSNEANYKNVANALFISGHDSESEHQEIQNILSSNDFNSSDENPAMACVFCHSSRESEASGPMIHYANRKLSVANQTFQTDIMHVHRECIDWAPQVYFDGETAKNLVAEVSRAARIKCSKCGQKGAALGCFAKTCRKSFHVPCAAEVKGCRWDRDDFLLLCPKHSCNKFPNDRSKMGKKVKNIYCSKVQIEHPKSPKDNFMEQDNGTLWSDTLDTARNWVICGSALSATESNLLAKFARIAGATLSRDWKPNVTHVIASTDEYGACSRTLKFLMAILSGKWILKIEWIKECLESKHPVPEESYEINHDIHGCFDGPKNGRIRNMEKAPPLFSGLSFYFSGHFAPSYKGYLEELISVAGGTVLKKDDMRNIDSKGGILSILPTSFVVYSVDPPQESNQTDHAEVLKKRLEEAEALAAGSASQVVDHTWLLDSIASCKLQHESH